MRLAGIRDYQSANTFLAQYLPIYNQKFAVQPASSIDSHEPLRAENDLELIFTRRYKRKLSKDLQFQYDRVIYQIQTDRPVYALQGREVTICVHQNRKFVVLLNQSPLKFKRFIRQPKRNALASSKDIEREDHKPSPDHPWRNYGHRINGQPVQSPN